MRGEPVVAGFVAFDSVVAAGLTAAVLLGWLDLSAEQVAAVVGFVAALSGLVAGLVRRRVVPGGRVEDLNHTFFVEGFDEGVTYSVSGLVDDILGGFDAESS